MERIPSILGRGYASLIVKAFNFRASRQNRSFPGFDTTVVRLLHGLLLSSMTPSSNILSISSSTTFCFAGDIGYGRSLNTRAPSISSMECLSMLVTPRPSLSKKGSRIPVPPLPRPHLPGRHSAPSGWHELDFLRCLDASRRRLPHDGWS
nr:uncharacterized protein LOC118879068 [Drosophila suzukii]